MSLTRESSTRESYLTLHVTYHQEMAIKNLYTSKGWLFKKKVLKVMFVDTGTEETGNDVVGGRDINISIDNTTDRDQDTAEQETDGIITNATVSSPDKVDNARVVIEKLKIETGTENEERTEKDNDETVDHDEDTDDSNDDWIANLNENDEDDDDEEYSPVKETRTKGRGAKRRSSGLKLSIRKGNSEKKAKRSLQSETVAKATAEKHVPSTSTAETDRDDSVGEGRSIVKTEDHSEDNEVPVDVSNIDLGLGGDTDRSALEIELQETDDIDHYETVHKTLSPDEPFSPPSDVRGSDGFSPSLGCYYCHDCGYTFQIQRWYNIHKWDGRCVYTCQVCSMKFTFRNITAYREHLKTHKMRSRSAVYRNMLKVRDPQKYAEYLKKQQERSRRIRVALKEALQSECPNEDALEKKAYQLARSRERQARYRARKGNSDVKVKIGNVRKVKTGDVGKVKTSSYKKLTDVSRREYWTMAKRKQRANMNEEQKALVKQKDKEKKRAQRLKQKGFKVKTEI